MGISSSSAIMQACNAPAPPATTMGNSRASSPRLTVISRTPWAMLLLITRYMPAAAASTAMPMGVAITVSMARRAAVASSGMRPPAKNAGSR